MKRKRGMVGGWVGGWFVCADFYAEWRSFAPLDGVGKGGARVWYKSSTATLFHFSAKREKEEPH